MKKYNIRTTDKGTLRKWFYLTTLGRTIDERAPPYLLQSLGQSYHAPCAGHDGIQLAVGQAFGKDTDFLSPYYRDMLIVLSAGIIAEGIVLNGISKATNLTSDGRHMFSHFSKMEWHVENVSSATATRDLRATGVTRAMIYYGQKGVAITSHGESATSEGYMRETVNGASNERLPVIFIFQDNGYGISVPKKGQTANRKVADNFSGFKNSHIIHCNGKDMFNSMGTMTKAEEYTIASRTPVIVQANCIRIGSHSNSGRHILYHDGNELTYMKSADPLYKFHRILIRYGRFTGEELKEIAGLTTKDLKAANRRAMAAPDPDPSTVKDYVLPEPHQSQKYKEGVQNEEREKETLVTVISKMLKAEFRHNPDTLVWRQDVANKEEGGVLNIMKGMRQELGIEQILNAPIAESYIVGAANGMCHFDPKIHVVIGGTKFTDYFWLAVEQYVECTHEYWRSNGQFTPNITLRLTSGDYIGGGLYHSQTTEGAPTSLPDVRIVYPSFADDATGLLRTSMCSKGFTLYLESKALYSAVEASAFIPEDFGAPLGKIHIRRPRKGPAIIIYGNTTHLYLNVAELLYKEKGWELEVIDSHTLIPLDKKAIFNSVKKTSKILIVHEGKVFSSLRAEIAGIIDSELSQYLGAPIQRVSSLFTPIDFHPVLERAILPSEETIYHAAEELLLH